MNAESKITTEHLQRAAYLYIRQSSLHQVLENTESTQRQYALRRRAVALGWAEEKIVVLDCDQGQSGASASDRAGFQQLVADVGLGRVGVVMGLEVSRLARNCADWHRLLELSALTRTLILDEDGLYDPGHYNDRLLLGLKGTMSEAELHVLKARLIGGILNKARRGELKMLLPIGLVYNAEDRVELDPDQQVQQSLRTFFATFARTGSAWRTVQVFREQGFKFPQRSQAGTAEIVWLELSHHVALNTLHNPRYAGAFCYGRNRRWRDSEGRTHCRPVPRDQWRFLKREAHPGYITWDEFLAHQQRLSENHRGRGSAERPGGPAREGPALLQGLVLCGKCGRAMTVGYHRRGGKLQPDYICQKQGVEQGKPSCQRIPGVGLDEAIGELLVASVTPLALETALQVQTEIQARLAEAAQLRQQQVQRAQYEAEQARVRYLRVDPNHRLVADTLEARWNEKLRLLADAREECERQERADALRLTDEQRQRILSLVTEFPKLWRDPHTAARDRKRIARLLLADVTLRREQDILVQVRFKAGATQQLRLPLPTSRKTDPKIMAEVDRLVPRHSESEIARMLNERGWLSGSGQPFTPALVSGLRRKHGIKSRRERLREQGWLTADEIAGLLKCDSARINHWRLTGLITSIRSNGKNDCLYQRPPDTVINEIRNRQRKCHRKSSNPAVLP